MPRPRTARQHPMRRQSDPGGGVDSFSSFRDTLKWLIPTCIALLSGLLWLQRVIAEQVVNSHEAAEQKELIAKIEGVRTELGGKVTAQWGTYSASLTQYYTKSELDSRRDEIYRRIDDERKNREDSDRTTQERMKDLETQMRQNGRR